MNIISLILKEIARRKIGFLLACCAVAFAAAGVVFTETVSRAFVDAMRRVTKKMGTNILVLPSGVDPNAFWAGETGTKLMDESLVTTLGNSKINADHYIGKLQQKVSVDGHRAVLTGAMAEVGNVGKKKPWKKPLMAEVPSGHCVLGAMIAERLAEKGKVGAEISVGDRTFKVKKVFKPRGPVEDVRIFINIRDAQEMLGCGPKIHAVDALGCLCAIDEYGAKIFTDIEQDIEGTLRDEQTVTATTYISIAATRLETRLGAGLTRWLTVAVLSALAVLVVAFYMLSDVRARRDELGMFLAVGFGPGRLVTMFLAKLVLIAVVGAVVGFAVGTLGATRLVDPEIYAKVAIRPKPIWMLSVWSVTGALGVSLLAGVLPTMLAACTDPAEVLRKS
ncbi:MAG: ABC transporter permease [Planctomycetota bacterium]